MRSFFSGDDRRLCIQRLQSPCIRHDGKRGSAFDRRRGGQGILPELVLGLMILAMMGAGAFGFAECLHEQAHRPSAGREGMR